MKGKDVEAVLAKLYPKFEEEKFLQMCEKYQIPLDKFYKRVLNWNESKAESDHYIDTSGRIS